MKIVVTGGAGFLGYHIAQRIHEIADYRDTVFFDIAPFEEGEYNKEIICKYGDVRDAKQMDEMMKNVDVVIHCAAALPLWKKKDIFETNVDGTRNVLEAAFKNRVDRVIHISSTAVYGVPDIHPLYEHHEMIGVGPYGESKVLAEGVCEEYRKKGLNICVLRPKSFIGTARLGVFQILYDWVESGVKIPIIGNGKNRYQLLEVEDLVDAIYLAAKLPQKEINDTFNVGAKEFKTVEEDVGAMCEYAGTGSRIMRTPAGLVKPALRFFELLGVSPLYKWIYGTADTDSFVSIEKAESRLGWQPKYSNAEALIRSYQWYIDNKHTIQQGTGVTHRIAWKQGVLGLFKKSL
ncbi:MAG: NAD(P)-dependent oxidoreductase [Ignavibacteriaceae bacterium]|nr:MAG: NAD(P)-dependent oxidoreductase [Chlorobiota bacterium]MBV6398635.1 UDP-glucose 4-epimerase [Ignavibacteria bacterium]MCC6885197.1 NAD(P)-dependent oxidoreductase [Ignavibacteriales bacterium]MCE7952013.1 NAD(P)-dependent oxidoreductase [Chlorobi bacterium CHB7]MDL1886429.1 NAD(P)-dependent oxidoreductase [Ignavibacteria bacterium CHB1]MEB2330417.1 NAD(P)-dependent oxidoreductase [Ignavibacteriaceae bacterium]RIK48874.1 MAG: epimerase [Ignavibacteriota bacterium]